MDLLSRSGVYVDSYSTEERCLAEKIRPRANFGGSGAFGAVLNRPYMVN